MVKELDSGKLMYSVGNNDECYTPDYGVKPILKYIPEGATVWCPFDTIDSEFTKQISKQNKVIATHISMGIDFFDFEPEYWDVMVSIHLLQIRESILREHYPLVNPLH